MKPKSLKTMAKRVRVVVNKNMVSHRNDPYFVKKNEEAWKHFKEHRIAEKLKEWIRQNPVEAKKLNLGPWWFIRK